MVNELVKEHFEKNYGLKVDYECLEQVYNPTVTGIKTLAATRDYLLSNGMSDHWADKLMYQYLKKIEKESYICTVLDCFSRPEAKGFL